MNRGSHILMAEDDPDDRVLLEQALRVAGVGNPLAFVEDGEELLEYLLRRGRFAQAPRPAVILLDLNMPRMDGREALAEVKAHPDLRAIPVIVLTTSSTPRDVEVCYALGANSFVTKPATFEALVNLARALDAWWLDVVTLPVP